MLWLAGNIIPQRSWAVLRHTIGEHNNLVAVLTLETGQEDGQGTL